MTDTIFNDMTLDKLEFAKNVYLGEFLIDQLESVTMQIEHFAKKSGIFIHTDKANIKKAKKAIHTLAEAQRKALGKDKIANEFGDNSEYLMQLLMAGVFTPAENRIKAISSVKLLSKNI